MISWKNFDTINADLDDAYSHPRNLAAEERAKAGRFGSAEADAGILGIRSGQRQLGIWQQARAAEAFGVLRLQCGPISVSAFSCSARDIERAILSMQPTRFAYPVDGLTGIPSSLSATLHPF